MNTSPPYLSHPLLNDLNGVRHGFFTRHGGVSSGLYDSLNGGLGSADDLDLVYQNRRAAAAALGGGDDKICGLYQVHSDRCLRADPSLEDRPTGDAIITNKPNITCLILTADCVPVLFADPEAGIVGAAHAGWRGAVAGIIPNTVAQILGLGGTTNQLRAVVGPAIQQASYQVGGDLRDQVLSTAPDAETYFIRDETGLHDDRWRFDLPGFVFGQLTAHGVKATCLNNDTYADDRFFSHRRATHQSAPDSGRLMSMIRLTQQ